MMDSSKHLFETYQGPMTYLLMFAIAIFFGVLYIL